MKKLTVYLFLFLFLVSTAFGLYINKPPLGRKINYALPLGRDVIAAYVFNEKTGDITIDRSLNYHHGTLKPATDTTLMRTISDFGPCLSFDGTGDYVEIADHDDFSPGNSTAGSGTPFSISMWVYIHDATYFVWASKWEVWGIGSNQEWNIYTGTPTKINFRVYDQSENASIGRLYNTRLDSAGADYENKWTHFVVTYDGGTKSSGCKIYLNGNRVDDTDSENSPGSFVAVENLDHAVWIGRYTTKYSDGLIDNVMFYKSALTANEICKLCRDTYSMF